MIGPPGPGASRVCLAKKEASVSRPTSAPDSLLNLKGSAGAKVVTFMTGATCIPWGLPGTGPGTRSSPHLPFAVVVLARGAAGAASCPCRCGEEVAGLPLCPMMLPPARSPGPSGLERALQVQGPRVMTAVGAARPLLLPVPLTAYLSLCVCVCVCPCPAAPEASLCPQHRLGAPLGQSEEPQPPSQRPPLLPHLGPAPRPDGDCSQPCLACDRTARGGSRWAACWGCARPSVQPILSPCLWASGPGSLAPRSPGRPTLLAASAAQGLRGRPLFG